MKTRLLMLLNFIFLQNALLYSAQYSVTEDTSAIGTTVRLLPAQQGSSESSALQPGVQQAEATPDGSATTAESPMQQSNTFPADATTPASPSTPASGDVTGTTAPQTPLDAVASQTTPGTLVITSVPDSISIVINDVNVGMTPYQATGFYPGLYEVTLYKEGFQPFRKTIELTANSTAFITGILQPEAGQLFVVSAPDSATVLLNDSAAGLTPFTSGPLTPGMHRLRIERTGYAPYSEQLNIIPKLTDTIQTTLVPVDEPVIAGKFDFKKSRIPRRIIFGSAGIAAAVTGIALNVGTGHQIKREQQALNLYMQTGKSEKEYDLLYSDYVNATKKTDQSASARNVWYSIALLCGVGLGFSIPF